MKQSKEVKGTVLSKNFNEKFADLVLNSDNLISFFCSTYKYERTFFLSDYMKLFKCSKVEIDRYYDLSNSDFKKIFYRFNVVDGSNTYFYSISIYLNCEIFIHIEDNNGKIVDSYTLRFSEDSFNCFINSIRTDEENASEPEQPVEDAEEQDNPEQTEEDAEEQENPEQTPAEDAEELEDNQAYELTPLERIIFRERDTCIERYSLFLEKAEEVENDDEYDNCRFDASVAIRIADYLEYIIMEVGLTEKWYSWLAERKKQEAVGVSK